MEDKFINKVTASFLADSYEEYAKKELQAPKPWIKMVETPGCRSVLNGFSRLRCVQILLCRISLFRNIPIFVNIFQSSPGDVLRCSYGQDMNFLSNILDFAANDKDRPLFHVTSWNWGVAIHGNPLVSRR